MARTTPNGDKVINDQFDFFKEVQLTDEGKLVTENGEFEINNLSSKQLLSKINESINLLIQQQKETNKLLKKIYNPY